MKKHDVHGSEKAFVHVFLSMGIKWHGKNRNKKRCGQRGGKNKKRLYSKASGNLIIMV